MPKWSKDQLHAALKELEDEKRKVSLRSVAKKFGIPPTTLHDHFQKKVSHNRSGKPTILTQDEEQEIVYCCQVLQELGFGLTKENVTTIVSQYIADSGRPNPFTNGLPGRDWWERFLKRWPDLKQRKPQHLPKQRALASNPHTVKEYFDKVGKLLEDLEIADADDLHHRLWYCDETGMSTTVASTTVLARRGSKWVHETGGGSGREMITILGCGSAAGQQLPPFVVYKGKNLYSTWTANGPPGACYSTSESGWMEQPNFASWFSKCFLPAVAHTLTTGPIVLFLDGHHSHLGMQFIQLAKKYNVHPFCIPSHTSHFLQPLDVGVYGPLKKSWKEILKDYKLSTRASVVTKQIFPSLLTTLWKRSFKSCHLTSGFRACGLFPFNPSTIPAYKTALSLPFTVEGSSPHAPTVAETPIRTELRHYFVKHLRPKRTTPTKLKRRRIIHATGEALTSDEVIKCLEDKVAPRKSKPSKKKATTQPSKKSSKSKAIFTVVEHTDDDEWTEDDEKDCNHCFECGKLYEDGEERMWIGCDKCYRWYHYTCAGFKRLLVLSEKASTPSKLSSEAF